MKPYSLSGDIRKDDRKWNRGRGDGFHEGQVVWNRLSQLDKIERAAIRRQSRAKARQEAKKEIEEIKDELE